MFKNMDFHRYVAKKDFFFPKYEFWKSQIANWNKKECDPSLYGKRIIMNKNNGLSARLYVFVCTPGTWHVSAHLAHAFYIREFKIWRRQRQRHKSIIWLVERRKLIVLHVQHAFGAMFWRSLPNDNVKFSYLTFWRQRELAAVNLSFFAVTWKIFVPSKRKCTSPILYNVTNME